MGLAFCLSALALSSQASAQSQGLTAADFQWFDEKQAALGQLLFYDKILSGNQNISCGTCHNPKFGSGDGLPLGIGEGGEGLGIDRIAGSGHSRIVRRVPRNAPALWNLGAKNMQVFMHDGRISTADTYGNTFNTPAEEWLPGGLNSLLAAQALFPLTSETEMAGGTGENEVSGAVKDRIDNGWPIVAKRVRNIAAYGDAFVAAFDHIDRPEQVTIVDIANALAAFEAIEFRSIDSPYDAYVAGQTDALSDIQLRGKDLFFGSAQCNSCHTAPLFTDQEFHALGLPAFGPGRTRRFDPIPRDVGRLGESDRLEDAYKFRTPMLRNVAKTGPYGHNGAYASLEDIIRHHADPLGMLDAWTPAKMTLPSAPWLEAADFVITKDRFEVARQRRGIQPVVPPLSDTDMVELLAFLDALTGTSLDSPPFGIQHPYPVVCLSTDP